MLIGKIKKEITSLVVTSVTIYDISKQILGYREIFFYQDHCFRKKSSTFFITFICLFCLSCFLIKN